MATLRRAPAGELRGARVTHAAGLDFAAPLALVALLDAFARAAADGIVHTAHPRYFGLFNPTPAFAGVLADALVAAFNPEFAGTPHAPAAVAIERHALAFLADGFGGRVRAAASRAAGRRRT